jgi:TonB-dependent starch-binding outer membrane protein SusC
MNRFLWDWRIRLAVPIFITLFFFCGNAGAQTDPLVIKGTVTDDTGETLPGVSIKVKGTQLVAQTSSDGTFSITVPDRQSTLVFTFLGFATRELPLNGETVVNVRLNPSSNDLNEVVVVGYGTQKKSDVTGSISTVSSKQLNSVPSSNVAELLRGKVPGLQVTTGSARPGGSSTIRIRGNRSLSGNNNPLFIVDGAPVDAIDDINAADVASVEVLKDASAAAIYGARAANGVILITTKRGASGKTSVTYSGYEGVQQFVRNFDLFTPEEFADMRREAFRANTATAANPSGNFLADNVVFGPIALRALESKNFVNWEDLVLRDNPAIRQHDIRVSGGSELTRISASVGYFSQDGIIPFSYYNRGSLRLNIDQKINKKISIGFSSYLSRSNERVETNLSTILTSSPLAEPFDPEGNLKLFTSDGDDIANPLFNLEESNNQQIANRANITLFADFEILKGLTYRINTNVNFRNRKNGSYLSTKHQTGRTYGGQATLFNNETYDYLLENILSYKKEFGRIHTLNVTALQSSWEQKYEDFQMAAREIDNDLLGFNGIANGSQLQPPTRSANRRAISSYMGRINYGLLDRYLLTLTGRVDGSSVFGANNKYAFFPSIALAWKIKDEPFLKNVDVIDALKLRTSYGQIGNQGINPYQTLSLTSSYSYVFDNGQQSIVGYLPGPNDFPNENLRWETTTTLNLGLDYSIFKGRFDGTLDYYKTNTTDLLVNRRIASASGFERVFDNLGETLNKGFEAALNANLFTGNRFHWSIGANYGSNRNEIISIFDQVDQDGKPINDVANNWFVGSPINVYYDYAFDGIWQLNENPGKLQPMAKPGHIKIKDTDNDGVITANDRVRINQDPKWYGSLFTNAKYKGFDLYAELNTVQGVTRLNPSLYNNVLGGQMEGRYNGIARDYWTPERPSNTAFRPNVGTTTAYLSAAGYQDASYVRLRTLTLGYTLPKPLSTKLKMNTARFYLRGTNLFTKTEYLSYGPESDPNSYPESRVFSAGLDVSF